MVIVEEGAGQKYHTLQRMQLYARFKIKITRLVTGPGDAARLL